MPTPTEDETPQGAMGASLPVWRYARENALRAEAIARGWTKIADLVEQEVERGGIPESTLSDIAIAIMSRTP